MNPGKPPGAKAKVREWPVEQPQEGVCKAGLKTPESGRVWDCTEYPCRWMPRECRHSPTLYVERNQLAQYFVKES